MQVGFVKETPVNTSSGLYSINTLTSDHMIYGFSFESDNPVENYILKLDEGCVDDFWEVRTDNFFIKAAADQTIYTHKHGFMSIADIQLGDQLLTKAKNWLTVIELKHHNICAPVWGITVKDPDNVFVKGILVGSANTEMSEMAKVTKEKMSSVGTKSVFKSPLKKIAKIYAKHGVVFVEGVEGDLRTLDVRTAAMRAQSLNAMPVPPWLVMHRNYLVEQIVTACREAKGQQLDPAADSITKGIVNVHDGKTWEGKELPKRTVEDLMLDQFALKYPSIKEDDLKAIIREIKRGLKLQDAELIMEKMEQEYIAQKAKEVVLK